MKYLLLTFFLFLFGCGGGYNPDLEELNQIPSHQNISGSKVAVLSGESTLNFSGGAISGTGAVRSGVYLSSAESAYNFQLKFKLNPDSKVTFISHSKKDLQEGVRFEFSRVGSATQMQVEAKAQDDSLDITSQLGSLDASQILELFIDVHNDHGDNTHILIWDKEGNKLLDDQLRAKGSGSSWGVELTNVEIQSFKVSSPKESH